MRMMIRSMAALAFAGTLAGTAATPAAAQGFYVEGPGFGIGVGSPAYRERYYPGYYDYNYVGPNVYSGRRYYGSPDVVYERRGKVRRDRSRNWD